MSRLLNAIVRLSLSAWVGAAVLFVTVAIRPIRAPELETPYRALLAGLLFPGYYAFGLVLLGIALIVTIWSTLERRQLIFAATLLALALGIIDWIWIYSPLAEIARKQWVEQAAPAASFRGYHLASMTINGVILLCSTMAAVLACESKELPR